MQPDDNSQTTPVLAIYSPNPFEFSPHYEHSSCLTSLQSNPLLIASHYSTARYTQGKRDHGCTRNLT